MWKKYTKKMWGGGFKGLGALTKFMLSKKQHCNI